MMNPLLHPISVLRAFLLIWLLLGRFSLVGAGIDRVLVTDSSLTVFPAAGNPASGHLVAMEFGDVYSGARGWTLAAGTGGIISLTSNEVLRLTFVPAGGTFGPVLTNAEVVNGTQVRYFAMRARVMGFLAGATMPLRITARTGVLNTNLPANGTWNVVRADLGAIAGWSGNQTLAVTIGVGGVYTDYENALVELDLIAVNDSNTYNGGLDYTRFDKFWNLGYPTPIYSGSLTLPITVSRYDGNTDRMYRRFQLVDDGRTLIGDAHFVDDWSGLSYEIGGLNRRFPLPDPASINGVDSYQPADFATLQPKCGKLNVVMSGYVDQSVSPAFTWNVDGIAVGLKKANFDTLVAQIKTLNDLGMSMYLTILNVGSTTVQTSSNPLIPVTAVQGSGTWIGHNTFDPLGRLYYRAFVEYLANRLSGPGQGGVTGFIIGNEVDQHPTWHQVGPLSETSFVAYQAGLLRLSDLAIRKYHPQSKALVSLTHYWTKVSTISPRTLLTNMNAIVRSEGNFPWGVAYHPYPRNLFVPMWWNDAGASNDFSTSFITYRNIEVLPQFLAQADFRYQGGERHLALTEQGFHTTTETVQAAAYAYAYRKMIRIPQIKAHVLHRYQDHSGEGGLLLGLRTINGAAKQIYTVFQNADDPDWRTWFDPYLTSLPMTNWDQAVPTWGSFNFHFAENGFAGGWQAQSQITGLTVSNGWLSGTSTGTDPQLQMQSFFASSDAASRFLVRMRVSTPEATKIYWKRSTDGAFSESRLFTFAAIGDNAFHTYEVNASSHTAWPGQIITGMRFDPIASAGNFVIDYFLGGQLLDFDADGIPDSVEGDATVDTDGDGIPDFADTDSDGDGIADEVEGAEDVDQDGLANYRDTDSDGDGVSDAAERIAGAAIYDLDDDNDGLPNVLEIAGDADGDGVQNLNDPDSDGDGMTDGPEADAGRSPWSAADLAFNFDVTGDFQNWNQSTANISGLLVTNGVFKGTAVTGDPQFSNLGFRFAGNTVTGIAVRVKASSAGQVQLFWGRVGADSFAAGRRIDLNYTTANQWQVLKFNAVTNAEWAGQIITRLRLDPISIASATFEVDFIRHADADLDGDGIADAVEGLGDPFR